MEISDVVDNLVVYYRPKKLIGITHQRAMYKWFEDNIPVDQLEGVFNLIVAHLKYFPDVCELEQLKPKIKKLKYQMYNQNFIDTLIKIKIRIEADCRDVTHDEEFFYLEYKNVLELYEEDEQRIKDYQKVL